MEVRLIALFRTRDEYASYGKLHNYGVGRVDGGKGNIQMNNGIISLEVSIVLVAVSLNFIIEKTFSIKFVHLLRDRFYLLVLD